MTSAKSFGPHSSLNRSTRRYSITTANSTPDRSFVKALSFLGFLTVVLALSSLLSGSANIFTLTDRSLALEIVRVKRLPGMITALLTGASLASCGVILQSWFRNPLAGPSVLGISSGAGLGIALAVMGGSLMGNSFLPSDNGSFAAIAAPLGASAVIIPILLVSTRHRSSTLLLVFGLLISYLTNALVSLLVHFSSAERVKSYISWTFGTFSQVRLSQVPLFVSLTASLIVASLLLTPGLNRLQLGDRYASSMGLHLTRFRFVALAVVSLSTGIITLYCGPIAFIGISAPHFSRFLLKSSDHRKLMPLSLLAGSSLALLADVLSRLPGGLSLPINALLALIGVPAVLTVMLRPAAKGAPVE